MFHNTEDIHIKWTKVVLPPVFLEEERPVTDAASATIYDARNEITSILNGEGLAPAGAGGPLLHSRYQGRARVRRVAQGRHCRVFQRSAHCDARLF